MEKLEIPAAGIPAEKPAIPTTASSYKELATFIRDQKIEIKAAENTLKALKADLQMVQEEVLPQKMEADELTSLNVDGIGRLTVAPQFRASVKAEHKMAMQEWLKENGFIELVQETINSSTLKAWVKEQLEEGNEVPTDYLNLHSFDIVTLTKK